MNKMNKYTLKFKYKNLEDEYTNYRNISMKIPVFKTGSVCIFLIATYKMIQLALTGESNLIPILIACQFFSLISLVLFQFRIHKIDFQLLILAVLLVAYEFIIKSNISIQALGLYGSNFTYCGIIIIMVSEYIYSIITILFVLLFRLISTILNENEKSYSIYTTTIICIGFLCFFSYKINQQSRINFLLCQQDYMWERIFPKILDKPYIIFSYNEEKMEFNYKSSWQLNFECNNTEQLKSFLREWKLKQNSIESILFESYKHLHQTDIFSNSLEIQNSKKEKQNIKFTIFKAMSQNIILSFEEKFINNESHNKQVKKIIQNTQIYKDNLLKLIYTNLKYSTVKGNKSQIRPLLYMCYIQRLMNKIKFGQPKIGQIQQKHLIEIKQLFNHKNLMVRLKIQENNISKFNISHFKRLVIEIFKVAKKKSYILIKIGEQSFIVFEGDMIIFEKNNQLKQIFDTLIQNIEYSNNYIKIFLFNEPQQSFFKSEI